MALATLTTGPAASPAEWQTQVELAVRFRDQMAVSEHDNHDGATEWPGLIRMLDRTQPDDKD